MKRILLKISGEYLKDGNEECDEKKLANIAKQLKLLTKEGTQIAIVIGGGNIFRGARNGFKFDRHTGDQIGMVATCINGLFLHSFFKTFDIKSKIYGTIFTGGIIKPFDIEQAREDLVNDYIVIFTGGTGHAFFSTDTAAALRAIEMNVDVLFKATNVDGIYDKDPSMYVDAKFLPKLTYEECCIEHYNVMDACAFELCSEQKIPMFIFNINKELAVYNAVHEKLKGTFVSND